MVDQLKKLIVVCGPTATGKSTYAVKLARKIGGEIVSADSRQVYKYLDIGTAKITKREMRGIPHHMLDAINPKRQFSVAQYQKKAQAIIKDTLSRGKIPILVGGTGFYIDAVIHNQTLPKVKPNKSLRKDLEKLSRETLLKKLLELDPRRAKTIDINNKVRLIRAIEITQSIGEVPKLGRRKLLYNLEVIYLDLPDRKLKKRIHKRTIQRMQYGLIHEVRDLHEKHKLSWRRLYELGLEYRYVTEYLRGHISTQKELINILDIKTWQYVRRQRTWFRKYLKLTRENR
jgi:tRNA dimethylallyltransferase